MASIIEKALGSEFSKLHPQIQARYVFSSSDSQCAVGIGTMDKIWSGSRLYWPFLAIGSLRNIMSPELGENIPFRIESWAYKDSLGRETLSLNRIFEFPKPRLFDEYVVEAADSPHLLIYVGSHQHLAVELFVSVSNRGGLNLRSGRQRMFTRFGSVRFPLLLSAEASIHEFYDDVTRRFRIEAKVCNRLLGDVFCATGSFSNSIESVPPDGVPKRVRAIVEQSRF